MQWETLLEEGQAILEGREKLEGKMAKLCEYLQKNIAHYDWVGFYLTDGDTRELVLGPYVGDATDHARIAFGEGICGQAADTEETFVVQDVSKESNYLSCSINVKSEIVVPIMHQGKMLGEIDIDSHKTHPFTEADKMLLEGLAKILGPMLA